MGQTRSDERWHQLQSIQSGHPATTLGSELDKATCRWSGGKGELTRERDRQRDRVTEGPRGSEGGGMTMTNMGAGDGMGKREGKRKGKGTTEGGRRGVIRA